MWVDDTAVTHCYECQTLFSFFLRKHHCRNCGRIFCFDCCNFWEKSSELKLPQQRFSFIQNKQKVCGCCCTRLEKYRKLKPLIRIFKLVKFDIADYMIISQVCKKWNVLATRYFSNFREIQYNLLDTPLKSTEGTILWINNRYFSKHSQWIMVLLKSLSQDFNNGNTTNIQRKTASFLRLIDLPKKTACWNLMCSRSCNSQLSVEDIAIALSYTLPLPITHKLIGYLRHISDSDLSCYLMLFLHYISNTTNIKEDKLAKLLINKASNSIEISHLLYWNINYYLSSTKHYSIFFDFQQMFLEKTKFQAIILAQHKFAETIIDTIYQSDVKKIVSVLENYCSNNPPIQVITHPGLKLEKILVSKIKIKNSSSKPVLIPCEVSTRDGQKLYYEMLYKNDDLRKEKIIMDIIILMDKILKKML